MKKYIFFYVLIVLTLFSSCSKKEHEHFATIYGVIIDNKSGEPIVDATIVLSPGGVTKVTGEDGFFEFVDLSPQQYTITVQKSEYLTNRKSVTAVAAEKVEVNMRLTVQ